VNEYFIGVQTAAYLEGYGNKQLNVYYTTVECSFYFFNVPFTVIAGSIGLIAKGKVLKFFPACT
jgi:hypothetical protein